ncbi:MAG: copper resistance CopC family protein [Steroidobacteraceae bacterium]
MSAGVWVRPARPAVSWLWLMLVWPLAALAHAHLQRSDPADGAVISNMPAQLTLQFSEAAQLTALTLSKAGQTVPQKLAPLPSAAATQLQVTAPRLEPGDYELRYRVISADGHIMAGKIHFTVTAR